MNAAGLITQRRKIVTGSLSALTACLLSPTAPPDREPAVTGTITIAELIPYQPFRVEGRAPDTLFMVRIEERPGVWDGLDDKVDFLFNENTKVLLEQPDGGWREGSADDISVGQIASGWYLQRDDYLILDTYPRRGAAGTIAVHRD